MCVSIQGWWLSPSGAECGYGLTQLSLFAVCVFGEVRPLLGGSSPQEGVVEVCAGEGQFFPVTLTEFTIREAGVLCRELNLGTGK